MTGWKKARVRDVLFKYSQLPREEQVKIDRLAATLERNVKARWVLQPGHKDNITFGRIESLELLFKIGSWMQQEGL